MVIKNRLIFEKESIEMLHENSRIEFKRAENALPKDFWETYSAFSNTDGGIIFLGVSENSPKNEITGVSDPEKVKKDLWNLLSNTEKVSHRTIENSGVFTLDIEGKYVIIIEVSEAPAEMKPVYLKNNIKNSYVRTGDGDRFITDLE